MQMLPVASGLNISDRIQKQMDQSNMSLDRQYFSVSSYFYVCGDQVDHMFLFM